MGNSGDNTHIYSPLSAHTLWLAISTGEESKENNKIRKKPGFREGQAVKGNVLKQSIFLLISWLVCWFLSWVGTEQTNSSGDTFYYVVP